MDLTDSQEKMLKLAEQLRQELGDARLCDEHGAPLQAIPDPLPAVEFVDAQRRRRALLEEAPDNRWLLQFFDPTGILLGTRSGRISASPLPDAATVPDLQDGKRGRDTDLGSFWSPRRWTSALWKTWIPLRDKAA